MTPSQEEEALHRSLLRLQTEKQLKRLRRQKLKELRVQKYVENKLSDQAIRISKVHVDGLKCTQDFLVKNIISKLLEAESYGDVLLFTNEVHNQLKNLGCFHTVNAIIDVSEVDNDALEVFFDVEGTLFKNT